MKKFAGYFVAAGALLFTALITLFAKNYKNLLDAFYPWFSRTVQGILACVSGLFPFVLWQAIVAVLVFLLVLSLVFLFIRRRSFVRWLGWVLAVASLLWTAHTTIHGLNFYASDLAQDLRLEMKTITKEELEQATRYYRDKANALAEKLPRDESGNLLFDDFDTLAQTAADGYKALKMQGYSVFAGSTLPVKKLGWKGLYSSMGICGVTMAVTGEAAVNPEIPNMSLPFVMCHEMAHRMAIASEDDANFAGFLACNANPDPQFQYSAYYMAYRYCINALGGSKEISSGVNDYFRRDLNFYNEFFTKKENKVTAAVADKANNTYIQVSGDSNGIKSYGLVATQLTCWYLQEMGESESASPFDPTDRDYITGIIGEKYG